MAFGAASQLLASDGRNAGLREIEITERRITERFVVEAEIGAEYRLDRLIAIYTLRDPVEDPAESATSHVNRLIGPAEPSPDVVEMPAPSAGVERAMAEHTAAWDERWRGADVQVAGDYFLQRALRFSAYHLISAANPRMAGSRLAPAP